MKVLQNALLDGVFCPSTQEDEKMETVRYKFNDGTEVIVENVPGHIVKVCKDFDREYEREKRQQSRYCVCFDVLNDKDEEIGIYDEYQKESDESDKPDYLGFIQTLTQRQLQVLKLLLQNKTPLEVAENLGISKQSINDIRNSIKGKFIKFFGKPSPRKGEV